MGGGEVRVVSTGSCLTEDGLLIKMWEEVSVEEVSIIGDDECQAGYLLDSSRQ